MRKKIGTLLIVGSLGALCAGLCACNSETAIDKAFKEGNVISVTYDGSGGRILGGDNVSIVDMFNPDKYTADAEGVVSIKLREPTDEARPRASVDPIKVMRSGYTLVGWYQNRTPVTNDAGNVIDEAGNELVLQNDGNYYLVTVNDKGETVEEKAIPQYTFSDPWDFESDRVRYKKGDEPLSMTLYAAWVKYFTFDYYYKPTKESEWTLFGTTEFDYYEAKAENEKEDTDETKVVLDGVFVPQWSEETGRMDHKYSGDYSFPSVTGKTFKAAYKDAACTQEITRSSPLRHSGYTYHTDDTKKLTVVDPVQNVYVEFDEGNHYRISKASQFTAIGDPAGHYEILSDTLDFGCKYENNVLSFPEGSSARWPMGLMGLEFTGTLQGTDGKKVTFRNVGAVWYSDTGTTRVGLFGGIGRTGVIKNVAFENVVLDIQKATGSREAFFGLLAGNIETGAAIENVSIGGEILLGEVRNASLAGAHLNLTANGSNAGITKTEIGITVYGQEIYGTGGSQDANMYDFAIDPTAGKTTVDANGNVTFVNTPPFDAEARKFEGQYHKIQYQTVNGGQENE